MFHLGHFGDVINSQSLGLILKKENKQQKQTCIHNKIYYNIKWTRKTKARFGCFLWPPAWKRNRSILERV